MRRAGSDSALAERAGASGGFILVAVLWILAALATLASIYSIYVTNVAFAAQVNDDRLRIRNAVSTGIELTAYQLLAAGPKESRPPKGAFSARLAHAAINVAFVSEGARVDLNKTPKALLEGLFASVGVDSSDAETMADRIAKWRMNVTVAGQSPESEAYRNAGLDYPPRQGPFTNTLELPLVLGIPGYIVQRVLPLVTVYSGVGQVDVRVASPQILSALPGMTPERLQKILAQRARNPTDSQALMRLLGPASDFVSGDANPATRVQVQIRLDNGRSARAEVVILVSQDDDEPFRVLSWRDDSDGSV